MRFLSLFALLFAVAAHALSATGGERLLVLLDDVTEKAEYSTFLGDLESRGFQISYETPKSETLKLFHLGERSYDHILFFPSKSKGLGPNLTPNILVEFINAEGNILLTTSASTTVPTTVVSLLAELDISLPADRTGLVVDHFNFDTVAASEQHDVLTLSPPGALRNGVRGFFQPETATDELIAFPSGVGHVLGSSAQLAPVLRAPKTAYIYNPKEQAQVVDPEELFAAGEQLALVSAFQARNSARFAIVGSAEMLSDKWFEAKVQKAGASGKVRTWNREFAKRVSGWAFQEIGVVRVNEVQHHLNSNFHEGSVTINPEHYKVENNVTYSVSLSEYSWDHWTPFEIAEDDKLQVEFTMLSPYYRLNLARSDSGNDVQADAALYSVSFGLPDQHGIFNFMLNHKRPFLTNLEKKETVSVHHRAHDEFTRSYAISGAWPWVTGIWTTAFGFVAFCAVWMYSAPVKATDTKKTQ